MFDTRFIARLLPALLEGAWVTVQLALLTFVVCLVWGLAVALVQQRRGAAAGIAEGYIQVMRNTPLLVQLYLVYYGFGIMGIPLSAWASGLLVLCLQHGAYVAEIYRGGLQSLPRGQREAARALGMRPWTAFSTVVFPQVLARLVPPLTNQATSITKDTSQVAAISVMELTKVSQIWLENSASSYDVFFGVAIVYLALTSVIGLAGWMVERRLKYAH